MKTEKLFKDRADFEWLRFNHEETDKAVKNPSNRMLNNLSADIIIGHNRKVTKGTVNYDNAQPFASQRYAIVHNGTLRMPKYIDPSGDRSDSFLMSEDINQRGIIPVLSDIKRDGAYSIVIFDKKEKKLYFVRNIERPLFFAINQKRNVMYWASEGRMLEWILFRNGIDYKVEKGSSIFELRDGVLFETTVPNIKPKHIVFTEVHSFYKWSQEDKQYIFNGEIPKEEKKDDVHLEKEIKKENSVVLLGHKTSILKTPEGKSTTVLCQACDRTLTLYEQYEIKNKFKPGFYNKDTDRYYCECVGAGALKKSVNDNTDVTPKTNIIH